MQRYRVLMTGGRTRVYRDVLAASAVEATRLALKAGSNFTSARVVGLTAELEARGASRTFGKGARS